MPGTPEEASNSIVNLVTMASSKGKPNIPMEEVLAMLHNEGYDLTPRMVMDALKGNKLVKRVTKDDVQLASDEAEMGMIPDQQKEKAEKHVEKLAKKTIDKDRRNP